MKIYKITNTLSGVEFYLGFKPTKEELRILCCKYFNNWTSEYFDESINYVSVEKIKIYSR
jgi:REP element-mobilizing transposase RayT